MNKKMHASKSWVTGKISEHFGQGLEVSIGLSTNEHTGIIQVSSSVTQF